jgi:hypothetical protein
MQHLKKELENPMSSITWVVGPNGERIPYNIKTDAGKRLWIYLNNQHGAGTWGLAGEHIPLIEKQVAEAERERIISIVKDIEQKYPHKDYSPTEVIDLVNGVEFNKNNQITNTYKGWE